MNEAPDARCRSPWVSAGLTAWAVLAGGRAAGQDIETRESVVRVDDSRTSDERLVHGDCTALVLAASESGLDVMVEMAKPFAEGMYTRVLLWIDCDDDAKTGLDGGNELEVRAACGTRFGPSAPPAGTGAGTGTGAATGPAAAEAVPPLSIRRCSWSDVEKEEIASTGKTRRTWMLREILEEPRVEDRELRFRIPKDLIRRYGDRYHSRFTAVARIDTVCCEQPILLEHVCADEGVAFQVDGSDEEWTGGTSATDPPGELHAKVASVDLVSATIDHSAKRLLALLRFQEPGFASGFGLEGPDVFRRDRAVVRVEPFLPAYTKPRTCEIPAGSAEGTAEGARWAVQEGRLELSIPRGSGESRFRVTIWSDAVRHDRVPDAGRMKLVFPP